MTKTKPKNLGGRPKGLTPPLATVSFRADEETKKAIEKLTAALNLPGVVGGVARGVAIRQALIEAARRAVGQNPHALEDALFPNKRRGAK